MRREIKRNQFFILQVRIRVNRGNLPVHMSCQRRTQRVRCPAHFAVSRVCVTVEELNNKCGHRDLLIRYLITMITRVCGVLRVRRTKTRIVETSTTFSSKFPSLDIGSR